MSAYGQRPGSPSELEEAPSQPQGKGDLSGTFVRFLGAGLLNTAFGYAAYALLILAGAPVWGAVGGATLLGIVFNFLSYGGLVFGSARADRLPRFIAVYAFLYLFNVALTHLLMAWGSSALLAQALLVPFLAALAFILMRSLVFSSHVKEPRHVGYDTSKD